MSGRRGGVLFYLRHCEIGETSRQRHPGKKKKKWPNLIKCQMPSCQWKLSGGAVRQRALVSAPQDDGGDGVWLWGSNGIILVLGFMSLSPPAHPCRYDAAKKFLKKVVFDSDYVHLVHRGIGIKGSKVTDKLWWTFGIFSAAGFLKASVQHQHSLMLCVSLRTLPACWCWLQVTLVHHMHLILHG